MNYDGGITPVISDEQIEITPDVIDKFENPLLNIRPDTDSYFNLSSDLEEIVITLRVNASMLTSLNVISDTNSNLTYSLTTLTDGNYSEIHVSIIWL